ncbi:MAG: diguanylate cyclase [Butyrivibrio sp.]|nr:diguanylate cyclase [Butyrivibrio sp.]
MRKYSFKWIAAALIFAAVLLSTIAYVFVGVDHEDDQINNILIAEMIDSSVREELSEVITVSRMMSQDSTLRILLENESDYNVEDMVLKMRNYLNSIQKKFGFTSVYVISDFSKNYYSYVGLNKTIDPENDSFDTWYTIFLQNGKNYELESSTDQVNRDRLTIFVDGRVEDDKGNLLGVSGVGLETEEIRKLLARFEKVYGVRTDYVSEDGLVQMSSRLEAVHTSYVSGITLPDKMEEDYLYDTYGMDGFVVTKYIEELGWYLVVRSDTSYGHVTYNYVFFFAEVLIVVSLIAILFFVSKNSQTEFSVGTIKKQNIDDLTGLPNRDYFIKIYGENGNLNTTQYKCIAEFSIDDFDRIKKLTSYDRIILSVARTAKEILGQQGQIIRWNNNSFVVLLETSIDEADEACRQFCRAVEDIGEVTVSVGLTEIDLNDTLKKNYYRAIQYLYLVKELGGNNVKRG